MAKGKLPFPRFLARTQVCVYQTALSEDGEPVETIIYDGLAIYDEKARQVMDAERRLVLLSGRIIIEGDIAPGVTLDGVVEVGGEQKTVYRTQRPRNPDGSVFSTELELS